MTPADARTKPARIRSASHAQNKVRLRRKSTELTCSEDQLNIWNKHGEIQRREVGDVIRRTRSMQISVSGETNNNYAKGLRPMSDSSRGRPTSADSVKSCVSTASRASSGKMRRALPKVPTQEINMEEKLKRMSQEAIKRASTRKDNRSSTRDNGHSTKRTEINTHDSHKNDNKVYRGTPRRTPPVQRQFEIHHHDDKGAESDESEFVNEVQLDSRGPTPLKTNLEDYFDDLSNDHPTPSYNNNNSSDYGSADPNMVPFPSPQNFTSRPFSQQRHSAQSQHSQNPSSQEALQRIIDDLKDAANKPFDNSSGSRSSSESSMSREGPRDHPYDFQQLAQWGVLEPTQIDLMAAGAQYVIPRKPKPGMDKHELKVTHPSLFKLLKSCELVMVSIERSRYDQTRKFGIEVFESVFSEREGKKGRRPIFRSPSGRRPVIGRRKSAFVPVSGGSGESNNHILSMPAIDMVDDHGPAYNKGLYEGDYILEVSQLDCSSCFKMEYHATGDTLWQPLEPAIYTGLLCYNGTGRVNIYMYLCTFIITVMSNECIQTETTLYNLDHVIFNRSKNVVNLDTILSSYSYDQYK